MTDATPADEGFTLPADFEPHQRTLLQWPTRADNWGERLPEAYRIFAQTARLIARYEPVGMIVRPESAAEAQLACGRDIQLIPIPIDDEWVRDTGPAFLVDGAGGVAGVAWDFNGWGNKLHGIEADRALAPALLRELELRGFSAPMVLEGSLIATDGRGTLIASMDGIANQNRNPEMHLSEIEAMLAFNLGVRKVIWLEEVMGGGYRSGHVATSIAFAPTGEVLVSIPEDHRDPVFGPLSEVADQLRRSRDASRRPLDVVEVPLPREVDSYVPGALRASYLGFYPGNGFVIVPTFDDPNDEVALNLLAPLFPGRDVIPFPALDIARAGADIRAMMLGVPKG